MPDSGFRGRGHSSFRCIVAACRVCFFFFLRLCLTCPGGIIPSTSVIILRKYPIRYFETVVNSDGSKQYVTRSSREEDYQSRLHEEKVKQILEDKRAELLSSQFIDVQYDDELRLQQEDTIHEEVKKCLETPELQRNVSVILPLQVGQVPSDPLVCNKKYAQLNVLCIALTGLQGWTLHTKSPFGGLPLIL